MRKVRKIKNAKEFLTSDSLLQNYMRTALYIFKFLLLKQLKIGETSFDNELGKQKELL